LELINMPEGKTATQTLVSIGKLPLGPVNK